jgi:hypothetical protein
VALAGILNPAPPLAGGARGGVAPPPRFRSLDHDGIYPDSFDMLYSISETGHKAAQRIRSELSATQGHTSARNYKFLFLHDSPNRDVVLFHAGVDMTADSTVTKIKSNPDHMDRVSSCQLTCGMLGSYYENRFAYATSAQEQALLSQDAAGVFSEMAYLYGCGYSTALVNRALELGVSNASRDRTALATYLRTSRNQLKEDLKIHQRIAALQSGSSSAASSSSSTRASTAVIRSKPVRASRTRTVCRFFNRSATGHCPFSPCRFSHSCSHCGGPHPLA